MSIYEDLRDAHWDLSSFDRALPESARVDVERELAWRQGRLALVLHHSLHLVMPEDDVRMEIDTARGAADAARGVAAAYLYDNGGPFGQRWWDTDAARYFGEYGASVSEVMA